MKKINEQIRAIELPQVYQDAIDKLNNEASLLRETRLKSNFNEWNLEVFRRIKHDGYTPGPYVDLGEEK